MERKILHVDVNNAFLSWTAVEMLENGSEIDIREIPAIIGGDESRRAGIVLAKSQKAKECGVKTAETIYVAKSKCPNLKIYPPNYGVYKKYSDKLYKLLSEYTEKIERFSIDECFLDMTKYLVNRSILDIANEINRRVREELKFTVNVGVAHNKLLAKMASDFTKPDRVHTLFENEVKEKMWGLPASELFMLGRKTVPKLYNMQIKTIGDLAKTDVKVLSKKFGKHGVLMWEYANGIDKSEVNYRQEKPKGIGNSITLPRDVRTLEELEEILLRIVEQVTYRLRRYDMLAKTVNVGLRSKDFQDKTHQGSLGGATSSTKEIYKKAKELLHELYKEQIPIRLVSMRVDNLVDKNEMQLSLFDNSNDKKQERLDNVLDNLKNKYGYNIISRAGKMNIDKNIRFK